MHVTHRDGDAVARPDSPPGAPEGTAHFDLTDHPAVRQLLGDTLIGAIDSAFRRMEWADEEIDRTGREHSDAADLIWHSFHMLVPTHDLMSTEMVYRAHCREILARVVAGEDTRPGTAAECCCVCCETSQVGPLHSAGVGLYLRMWQAAGFPEIDERSVHYEALSGTAIDEYERTLRTRLRREDRRLPDVIENVARCPWTLANAAGA
jgi:hypothetical protein